MYAAAGGASIANRRKQKRLQLNRRDGAGAAAAARARNISGRAAIGQQSGQQPGKLSVGQHVPPSLQLSLSPEVVRPSYGFHSSHEHHHHHHHHNHHRNRGYRRGKVERDTSSAAISNNYNNEKNHNNRHGLLAPPPISPIIQFPISPPPLSLESQNSLVSNNITQAIIASKTNVCPGGNKNSSSAAAVAFPFPPPSFLDLRVSPSASELQCGSQGPGKAAWQGCARPSPLPLSPASPQGSRGEGYKTKQCEAHRRWMKRNRIRDASYCYGSSGEDDDFDDYEDGTTGGSTYDGRAAVRRRGGEVNAAVNTVLYAGLGTTALGLVISFVGTGEKGFLSPELKLVGPSLLCAGLLCCLLRVLLCLCLCRCCGECRWRPCKLVTVSKDSKGNGGPSSSAQREKTRNPPVKPERIVGTSASGDCSATFGSNAKSLKQPIAASFTSAAHPLASTSQQQQQQKQQTPVPSSSSCSTAKSHKAHELLLSPAQLSE